LIARQPSCYIGIKRKEDPMSDFKVDKFGGEFREVDGKETFALWVPMSAAEKEAIVKKAKAENVDIAALTGSCLREWLKAKELSTADLEKVAGGGGMPGGLGGSALGGLLAKLGQNFPGLPGGRPGVPGGVPGVPGRMPGGGAMSGSTYMCPW
jgi:hypothetical protein